MPHIRVLALQPPLRWQQGMPNMHVIRQTIEKHVAAAPADLLVLPEVFNGVVADDDPLAGPMARKFLATLAKACNLAVVGSIDLLHDDRRIRNTAFVVDRHGNELGQYSKRVLFGREVGARTPGESATIVELGGVRVGVLICGDIWRADLVAELRGRIDVLCVPVKTTIPDAAYSDYARRLWSNLAITRAMENGVPVVVADWCEGRHESVALVSGQRVKSVHYTAGATCITDPSKRPNFDALQQGNARGEPCLLTATLDLDAAAAFRDYRRNIGLLSD